MRGDRGLIIMFFRMAVDVTEVVLGMAASTPVRCLLQASDRPSEGPGHLLLSWAPGRIER